VSDEDGSGVERAEKAGVVLGELASAVEEINALAQVLEAEFGFDEVLLLTDGACRR
jgi:hypothetical protein